MNDANAWQQIVEKVRDSNNILVTVSKDPSVDELSAALGLTVMLNNMNKHATAIFSGAIPPAIEFLRPDKTFENTVDSLRDFIIALDKEKADHLRYKVDGDVVKIFITPYRTTIGEKDLEFSQGDYNVELVLALGVTNQSELDEALEAHGRIFHDATVATITVGDGRSDLGSITWNERSASAFGEMMVTLADALKKDDKLLDEQTSTAFLTGIVAKTDRFSNSLTTPKAMTVAAKLMNAGANQQLIATKLQEANEIRAEEAAQKDNADGSTNLNEGQTTKVKKGNKKGQKQSPEAPKEEPKKQNNGELTISHEKQGDLDEVSRQTAEENLDASAEKAQEALAEQTKEQRPEQAPAEPTLPEPQAQPTPEQELANQLASINTTTETPSVADLQKDIAAASAEVEEAANEPVAESILPPPVVAPEQSAPDEPSLGGTLNATTERAAEEKRRQEKDDRNRTILSHEGSSYMGNSQPTYSAPLNASVDPGSQQDHAPLPDPMNATTQPTAPAAPVMPPNNAGMTLAQLDQENRAPHDEARDAISAAFAAQDAVQPVSDNNLPPAQPAPAAAFPAPAATFPVPAPQPSALPPLPDFSTLPPLPPQFPATEPEQLPQASPAQAQQPAPASQPFAAPVPAPTTNDPGQFKIPGQ